MPKLKDLHLRERLQFQMLVALSTGAAGLTAILYCTNAQLFQRFISSINPAAAALSLAGLGFFILAFLLSKGWFAIYK